MFENATTTMTSVYFIAPHLFTKKRSSKKLPPRHRLPLSPLNETVMSTSGNDSDPQLDARSLQYTRDDLRGRLGKDSQGETVIRRVSGRTDTSDTSSSVFSGALSVARGNEDLTQLLKDAEDRADQRLRAAEERAEERRVSDLRVAEDRVDKLLKAAEERRVSDLKMAEERRVSDLKVAEERLRDAGERADRHLTSYLDKMKLTRQ